MARFWKNLSPYSADSLIPQWIYYVEVCSFTFHFSSLEEIENYRVHFAQKIRESSVDRAFTHPQADWRTSYRVGDHWDRQTPFDFLPLYLFEEPKRLKVVKALERP